MQPQILLPQPPAAAKRRRVAVTGCGVVSPLGIGKNENLGSLQTGYDAVREITNFDLTGTRCKTAGLVSADFLLAAKRKKPRLHPAAHMLSAALAEAMEQAGGGKVVDPELIVIGTTSGGMTFGEEFYRILAGRGDKRRMPGLVSNYMPQKPVLDALEALNLAVPMQIIANACASGTNAIGHAFSLIQAGRAKSVLCGGYDAMSELVFVGFDSLQASTGEKIRPFDANRTGLVLGEGAAVLVLEDFDAAQERGAPILAEITGYGLSTDNYHLTQPHPSGIGPKMAMERALKSASRRPAEIDYLNAHGTATQFNDATEGIAISQIFGEVPVSSTKSMMGHSLGAAGAIEAVFCLLAVQNQFLPPNINSVHPDPQNTFSLVANSSRPGRVRTAMSNSFGFGGTNATIILEEVL